MALLSIEFHAQGKSRTQFVRRHDLSLVEQQVRNYQRLKNLTDRWVALGMALSRLRLREQHEASEVSERDSAAKTQISRKKRS